MINLRIVVAVLAVLVLGSACGEFAVVNPYDPRYSITVTISGPDSAFSVGDTLQFAVNTTPPWVGTPPVWTASGLTSLGGGKFRVVQAGGQGAVSVQLGPHKAVHYITLTQIAVTLRFSVDTLRFNADDQPRPFGVSAFDSSGTEIGDLTGLRFAARDTQVAKYVEVPSPSQRNMYSVGAGTTWVVVSKDLARDSMFVIVRQLPAAFECSTASPSDQLVMSLQDSLQLSVTRWIDSTGHTVESPPVTTGWIMREVQAYYPPGESMEVTPTGMVYSNQYANVGTMNAQWRTQDSTAQGEVGSCYVRSE
ncbi:MAG TPA: hypothetical protein VF737_05670 [Gemmatimonadaceae bacterium]